MKLLDVIAAPFKYVYDLFNLIIMWLQQPNEEDGIIANLVIERDNATDDYFDAVKKNQDLKEKLEDVQDEVKRLGASLLDSLKSEFDLHADLNKVQKDLDFQQNENIKQAAKLAKLRKKLANR